VDSIPIHEKLLEPLTANNEKYLKPNILRDALTKEGKGPLPLGVKDFYKLSQKPI
jgi:hypothetical protein